MAQTPIPFALHPTVGHATPIHKRSRRPNFDSASMTKPSFNLFGRQNHCFLGFGGFRGVSVGFSGFFCRRWTSCLAIDGEIIQFKRMTEPFIQVIARAASHKAILRFHERVAPCALGPRLSDAKIEGDGATPLGVFALRRLYYRPDRWARPETALPISEISQKCGWSDDIEDKDYNRYVPLPHSFSHEALWRDDGLYDAFIALGYNDDPIIAGKGSAIFLHLQKNDFQPTRGCVAIDEDMMRFVLAHATPQTKIEILRER